MKDPRVSDDRLFHLEHWFNDRMSTSRDVEIRDCLLDLMDARARVRELETNAKMFLDMYEQAEGTADRLGKQYIALREAVRDMYTRRPDAFVGESEVKKLINGGGGDDREGKVLKAGNSGLGDDRTNERPQPNRPAALSETETLRARLEELEKIGNELLDERDKIISELNDELRALREAVRNEALQTSNDGAEPIIRERLLKLTEGGGGESRGLCQPESAHRPVALRLLVREGVWYVPFDENTYRGGRLQEEIFGDFGGQMWIRLRERDNPALYAACEAVADVYGSQDGLYTATPETCEHCHCGMYQPSPDPMSASTCHFCHGHGYTYTIMQDGEE